MKMIAVCFVVGAQTPVPILSEDFANGIPSTWTQIDADGDGFAWLSSTASNLPGHNNSVGCAFSPSYGPGIGAMTPDNWLVTPALSLLGPSTLSFWVCAQDVNFPSEHWGVYISTTSNTDTSAFTLLYEETFVPGGAKTQSDWQEHIISLDNYVGQTVYIAFRHFNCTDWFYLDLDDVTVITMMTDAFLMTSSSALDFGTVALGSTSLAQTVQVAAYNNTDPIAVTVTAPFSVSADSTTFGISATLPDTGGLFYVRYSPTVVGADSAVATLTAGTASTTIALSGYGIDCSPFAIPLVEDFEDNSTTLGCWNIIATNVYTGVDTGIMYSYSGSACFVFYRDTIHPQYLISPELSGTGNGVKVELMSRTLFTMPENIAVGYSTTTNDVAAFTWGTEPTNITTTTYQQYAVFIPTPDVKFIAIKCMPQNYIFVDSLVIKEAPNCIPPTGLAIAADGLHDESVDVIWDNADVDGWNVQWRVANGDWASAHTTDNGYTITGLTAQTTYEIQVQADCGDNNLSEWSGSITATTTNVGLDSWLAGSVSLYPNPAKEYVDIRVDGDVNVTAMEVYDVYGKIVRDVETRCTTSLQTTRINVSGLADGLYFVRVMTDRGAVTKTFVKK